MKNLFKKLSVGMLAVAMAAIACVSVFAAADMTNMVFAGYDTTSPMNPNKVYNEVIGGKYTGKQVLVPVTPEWRVEGYEADYPHAGYSRMYLEGNKQVYTAYNNLFPQWETRRVDYFWELKAPYYIYERQQTKIENKTWAWDYGNEKFGIADTALLFKTAKQAVVISTEYKPYGFGRFTADAKRSLTTAENSMYNYFNVGNMTGWENQVKAMVSSERPDAYGNYSYTDEKIQSMIPVVYSKYMTAKFNATNNEGLDTKSFAGEYLANASAGWEWDADALIVRYDATIGWSAPLYELDEPYYYYQFLIVNGVVMDGHKLSDGSTVPYITRYTGGVATPVITWEFDHFEEYKPSEGLYEVVMRKFVDGKATDTLRKPSGEYGKVYVKISANLIQVCVEDGAGNMRVLQSIKQGDPNNLGGVALSIPMPVNFGLVTVGASKVGY